MGGFLLSECIPYNYFANANNVLMTASHQGINFPQRGDGKAKLFFVQFEFLQRDYIPG